MPRRRRISPFLQPIFGAEILAALPDDGGGDAGQGGGGAAQPAGDAGPAGGDQARVRDLQEERRRRQVAEKERDEYKAKAEAADQATQSDVEKATNRATAAERDRDTAQAELGRLRAAQAAGLDLSWADRLRGSTPEELEADAKALKESLGTSGGAAAGTAGGAGAGQGAAPGAARTPAPDRSQGARETAPPSGRDAGLAEARKRFGTKESPKG